MEKKVKVPPIVLPVSKSLRTIAEELDVGQKAKRWDAFTPICKNGLYFYFSHYHFDSLLLLENHIKSRPSPIYSAHHFHIHGYNLTKDRRVRRENLYVGESPQNVKSLRLINRSRLNLTDVNSLH